VGVFFCNTHQLQVFEKNKNQRTIGLGISKTSKNQEVL
jgi:hypothetical protein